MQRPICLSILAVAALFATACQMPPAESAAPGATPPLGGTVGPIPGVASQPTQKTNPYAQDRIALAQGRVLFVHYNCSGCHGGHAGGGMGPSLRDETWIYGGSDADVFESITQGRAHGMPAWGTRLPEEQIWKLAAYVKSLRTPLEPDAPEQSAAPVPEKQ